MKHIRIVQTLCLFVGGYYAISLLLSMIYLIFQTESNTMLILGAVLGLTAAYLFFKVFNFFEKLPKKQSLRTLCTISLILVALQVIINYYIAENNLISPVIEATKTMNITLAIDIYVISLVLGGLYLGHQQKK